MTAPIGVMHVIDTLEAGGAERMAVNLVNALPRDQFQAYLCATRRAGPLAELVASDVATVFLHRRSRFDARALRRLAQFIRDRDIRLLHAHETSLFISAAGSRSEERRVGKECRL